MKKIKLKLGMTNEKKLIAWRHPGGKLLRLGPESLKDSELIAVLIGSGVKGQSAEKIGEQLINKFQSFRGLTNQPLEKLKTIKGLKEVKITRIVAAFEIARRIVNQVIKELND